MDIYNTPESNLDNNEKLLIKPVRAIIYGLLIAVVLTQIVSGLEVVILGVMTNIDFNNEKEFQSIFVNNPLFLYIDLFVSAVVLYLAGIVVSKHTPTKEIKYLSIVAILTFIYYSYALYASGSFDLYPVYYNIATIIIIPAAIIMGGLRMRYRARPA